MKATTKEIKEKEKIKKKEKFQLFRKVSLHFAYRYFISLIKTLLVDDILYYFLYKYFVNSKY